MIRRLNDTIDRIAARFPELAHHVARWGLVIVFTWLGAMQLHSGGAGMTRVLDGHVLLPIGTSAMGQTLATAVGLVQIALAAALALGPRIAVVYRVASLSAVFIALVPLTLLFTNPVWAAELGGFPAIGSGQGLIKYIAIVGLAWFVHARTRAADAKRPAAVMVLGLLVPLVWIGLMKFTAYEAAGIEPLLASSPFFAWMLSILTVQGASNVIGIAELITAALLTTWWWRRSLFPIGALLAAGTFVGTLSFLATLPGWHATAGFPALSGAGIFLIKDVTLLSSAVVLVLEGGKTGRREDGKTGS